MNNIIIPQEPFSGVLNRYGIALERNEIELLQLNITKRCNQTCVHCHVDANQSRKEEMSLETIEKILQLLKHDPRIKTVDITGGAPELNTNFRYLVSNLRRMSKTIIDRCNLTVLFEKGQEDTPEFLAENNVSIFASLPCYLQQNVDGQRGDGVFQKSIRALINLNKLGYGKKGSGLVLNLIHNPIEPVLPGNQQELEEAYKLVLEKEYGITFNQLYVLTNMPINRYYHSMNSEKGYQQYMELLTLNFNPIVADKIMCKNQISIGWDGKLYDCDFNQALSIPIHSEKSSVFDIDSFSEVSKTITYVEHCYGCTAGCGSSCQGELKSNYPNI